MSEFHVVVCGLTRLYTSAAAAARSEYTISPMIEANRLTGTQSMDGRVFGTVPSDFEVLIKEGVHSCSGQAGSFSSVDPAICPTRRILIGTPARSLATFN